MILNTINTYPTSLCIYNKNISQTASTQTHTSSTAPTMSAATAQATDSVSISQQALEAYQALNQSLVNSLSPDDPSSDTLENILVGSIQASMQPLIQTISDKANAATAGSGSVASVAGASSPTGSISTDWGSALDSLVSSGKITQGQKTSIETAINIEAQSKVRAASTATTSEKSTSNLINLLV